MLSWFGPGRGGKPTRRRRRWRRCCWRSGECLSQTPAAGVSPDAQAADRPCHVDTGIWVEHLIPHPLLVERSAVHHSILPQAFSIIQGVKEGIAVSSTWSREVQFEAWLKLVLLSDGFHMRVMSQCFAADLSVQSGLVVSRFPLSLLHCIGRLRRKRPTLEHRSTSWANVRHLTGECHCCDNSGTACTLLQDAQVVIQVTCRRFPVFRGGGGWWHTRYNTWKTRRN